jgi:hypothetical protein
LALFLSPCSKAALEKGLRRNIVLCNFRDESNPNTPTFHILEAHSYRMIGYNTSGGILAFTHKGKIFDGAQSVLGYFGFDRTVYGDKRNTALRKWRWLQELTIKRKRHQNRDDLHFCQ